jgi:enoyl-CoA hydratase/carnithine racemase
MDVCGRVCKESNVTTVTEPAVLVETDAAVSTLWLNRPERLNAFGRDLSSELIAALDRIAMDPEVRGVVITGRGRAFSAGADLKDPRTHRTDDLDQAMESPHARGIFDVLSSYPKPVVAAVNGYAIGVGCLMTLCCDFIYASEAGKFMLPQVRLGILPAYGGGLRLARAVGNLNAAEMILTGRTVSAQEAAGWGMVTRVLPADELVPYAQEMMRTVAGHPPVAVRLARESLRQGIDSGSMRSTELGDTHRLMLLTARQDTAGQHQAWRDNRGAHR